MNRNKHHRNIGRRTSRVLGGLYACLLLALVTLAGCRGPRLAALAPDEIEKNGTATFQAPRERVFDACVEALRDNGYQIATEDADAGIILTDRFQSRSVLFTREGHRMRRRYELAVREGSPGTVEVVATPRVFAASRELAEEAPASGKAGETDWTTDEERAEWRRLFGAVRKRLAGGK